MKEAKKELKLKCYVCGEKSGEGELDCIKEKQAFVCNKCLNTHLEELTVAEFAKLLSMSLARE